MQTTAETPVVAVSPEAPIRRDLVVLGGLAVVIVVVCHVWFGRQSVAIDVLLVLTGYLLGSRVLGGRGLSGPGAELQWWARRLLPPLAVMLAVSTVLTVAVQPQTRWSEFADQTLASLGFFQNWELITAPGGLGRVSEAASPLQHLWALSVLGQFLLFFVLLAAAVRLTVRSTRWQHRTLIGVSALVMVASFGYAVTVYSDAVAYYSTLARVWQPLAGVLAAAAVARVTWSDRLRGLVGAVALATVLAAGMLLDGVGTQADWWALIPVLATVVVILAGASWPWLTRAPLVRLGSVAYPLYLWHWPLLIFWLAYVNDDAVGLAGGAMVIAAATLAAVITALHVDTARTRARLRRLLPGSVVIGLAVTLAVLSQGWLDHATRASAGSSLNTLSEREYPGALALTEGRRVAELPMRPTVKEALEDLPPASLDGCVTNFAGVEVRTCVYGDPKAQRTIAVAGGSHSEHWLPALHTLGLQHEFRVTTYLKMGCPLTTEPLPMKTGTTDTYPECRVWSDAALAQIITDDPDYVFFTTTRPNLTGPGDYVPDHYLGIWDELSDNGIRILGIRDTPWMFTDGWFFSPAYCLGVGGDTDSCGLPRAEVLSERNPTLDHLGDYPLLSPLDLSDAVCRPDTCRAVEGNVLVYHDPHHLSNAYVRSLSGELARQLREATDWW